MDERRYQALLDCVLEGRCVLVLGPELFRHEGKLLNQLLCEYLRVGEDNDNIDFFDPKDELFYFKGMNPAMAKSEVYLEMKRFYNGLSFTALHEKIAQMPFPLIVNTTPDLLLANAFEKNSLPHEFRFYHKKLNRDPGNVQQDQDEEDTFNASPDYPLIYNLTGHIGYEESLILTYSDLFDFLFNVFGRNNLPFALRNFLEIQDSGDAKHYLFLGFRFNKWYLQVMLRLLNTQAGKLRFVMGEGMSELERGAMDKETEDKGIFYLQNYFTFKAIDANPELMLERLFNDCAAANKLRRPVDPQAVSKAVAKPVSNQPLFMTLQEWMMRNKISRIFDALHQFFQEYPNDDALKLTLMSSAKYEELLHKETEGLLYHSEVSAEKSKVLSALNSLIQEVKKFELSAATA